MRLTVTSIVFTMFLAGCTTGVKPPIPGRADPFVPRQVMFADQDLADKTAFKEPILTRDDAGILFISVPIRAATDLTLRLDWRVTFFDRNNQTLTQSGWRQQTLYPNVFDRIEARSSSPAAVDFQIDLRYAR